MDDQKTHFLRIDAPSSIFDFIISQMRNDTLERWIRLSAPVDHNKMPARLANASHPVQ
jgi:hypothetical protein